MTHPTITGTATPVRPGDWAADPAVCTLTFAVRNFGLRTVTGQIPLTSAVIHVDPGGQPVSIRAELDAQGIDTGNRRRDKDLRGHRFLATGRWPAITFEAHYPAERNGLDDKRDPHGQKRPLPGTAPGRRPGHPSRSRSR